MAFILWTAAVSFIDVQPIGPENSRVGFAALNQFVHQLTGVHMGLYMLTDWLSLIPLGFVAGFGFLGLFQWIQRKSLLQVDRSILVLGGFYLLTGAVFLFFEKFVVNYRPVLMEGILEASYPSSTTMLVLCVMLTAAMQLKRRIRNSNLQHLTVSAITVFTALMVIGRLVSGVHWFTDIIGGILLSMGLVTLYSWLE
jgi:undecaprenyl-diphosphatase